MKKGRTFRITGGGVGVGLRFKNAYELLNLTALKISTLSENRTYQCKGNYVWNFKGTLKYLAHTLNWKKCILSTGETLGALWSKSS